MKDECHTSDGTKKILDDQIGIEENKRISYLLEDGFRKVVNQIPDLQSLHDTD